MTSNGAMDPCIGSTSSSRRREPTHPSSTQLQLSQVREMSGNLAVAELAQVLTQADLSVGSSYENAAHAQRCSVFLHCYSSTTAQCHWQLPAVRWPVLQDSEDSLKDSVRLQQWPAS
jgi:hypothetical protein